MSSTDTYAVLKQGEDGQLVVVSGGYKNARNVKTEATKMAKETPDTAFFPVRMWSPVKYQEIKKYEAVPVDFDFPTVEDEGADGGTEDPGPDDKGDGGSEDSGSEDSTEDKSEGKTEDKSESKSEDKSEDKAEDKSEDKTEDKSESKSEDKSEDKAEDKSEDKAEDKSESKTEDESEDDGSDSTNFQDLFGGEEAGGSEKDEPTELF